MSGTRRKPGLLGPHVGGYRAWLVQQGYTPDTVRNMLKELGQDGRWMEAEGLEVTALDEGRLALFRSARLAAGYRRVPGTRALSPLLKFLREVGVVPAAAPVPATPQSTLLGRYRSWMVEERNLSPATVLRYENTARRFLREQALDGDVFEPAGLTGEDVNAFLLRECARVTAGSAKGRVAELRSLLRFLYLQGITPLQLGTAVPPVGGWRLAPHHHEDTDIQRLLDHCDRSTPVGVRDYAIIMLVARLGLRSIEVARLELRDVDWRSGSSWSAARDAATTGFRCPRRSARLWSPT